nr:MAG TPA: hypothetical protein [Caudoviricetes sp.]
MPANQDLPACESFNKRLLPPEHTATTRTTHASRKGSQ